MTGRIRGILTGAVLGVFAVGLTLGCMHRAGLPAPWETLAGVSNPPDSGSPAGTGAMQGSGNAPGGGTLADTAAVVGAGGGSGAQGNFPSQGVGADSRNDDPGAGLSAMADPDRGMIVVSVRWPRYGIQAVPFSTREIALLLMGSGSVPAATASILRPASSATLSAIATGSYTLTAAARRGDAGKTVVAEASASIRVFANRVANAVLKLVPKFVPQLDFLDPQSGPPGTTVRLYGINLAPPAGGTYSVTVDGVPLPGSKLQPGSSTIVITEFPDGNSATAAVAVSVDGIPVQEDQVQVFTRFVVDHLRIVPASASLTPGATMSFSATAYRDAAETQTVELPIDWRLEDMVPPFDPFSQGLPAFSLDNRVLTVRATGSVTVVARAGGREARAYVKSE